MTVSNSTRAVTFTGNGVTTAFPFAFLIPADTAVITLTEISSNVEGDPLVLGVDYSITGEDDPNGGTVTYPLSGSPLASTHKINIKSILEPAQTLDLTIQSAYNPEQLENQLDRMVLVQLQVAEQLSRAVLFAPGSSITAPELFAELNDSVVAAAASASAASGSAAAALSSENDAEAAAIAAAASEAAAAASEAAAAASESSAAADAASIAGDAAAVAADAATVAADKAIVAADKATVAADKADVAADKAATDANVALTAADVISAEAAKVAAEAAAGSLTPVEDQINAASVVTFLDADHLVARKASNGALIKDTWAAIKTLLNTYFNALGSVAVAAGDLLYGSGAATLTRLAKGTAGQVLTMNAGATAPEWAAPAAGGISSVVVQKITATGIYTPTSGMLYCIVELVGGGAGGQSVTDDTDDGAGGGGAGGYSRKLCTAAEIGASQSVTIGAGGAANSAGGTTSFGAIMSATGGAAGASDELLGTLGGLGSGGDVNARGMRGMSGAGGNSTSGERGGDGGSSPFGAGGTGDRANADGAAATGYGSGGAGAYTTTTTNRNGGAGAAGVVIITEFVG